MAEPSSLYLFGTDNKIYTIKDPSMLTEVKPGEGAPCGCGVKRSDLEKLPQGGAQSTGDVSGHHLAVNVYGGLVWHVNPLWGPVFVPGIGVINVIHHHPFETPFAIIDQ